MSLSNMNYKIRIIACWFYILINVRMVKIDEQMIEIFKFEVKMSMMDFLQFSLTFTNSSIFLQLRHPYTFIL